MAARLLWLLDLRRGDRVVYRAAETDVDAPGLDGVTVPYVSGLTAPDYEDRLDLFSLSPAERRAAVSVLPETALWDPPREIADGLDPAALTGVLRLWVEDTEREFLVRIEGRLHDVVYGAAGEPVEFDVVEEPSEDTATYPGRTTRIDGDTWPSRATRSDRQYGPTIIGAPGASWTGIGRKACTPAWVVDTAARRVLIAAHHVLATTIRLRDVTTGTSETCAVTDGFDGLGNPVATAVYAGAGAIATASGYSVEDEFAASWEADSGDPVYGLARASDSPVRGAGDVVVWALRQTTLRVDWGRMEVARPRLNTYPLDTWIAFDEPESLWSWLAETVLPLLPVSTRVGPDGLYLHVWDFEARDPTTALTAQCVDPDTGEIVDGVWERASPVEYTPIEDAINDVTVRYGYAGVDGRFWSRTRLSGDAGEPGTLWTRLSHARYGRRRAEYEARAMWAPAGAEGLAAWRARAFALPWRRIRYRAMPEATGPAVGASVTLTDAALYLDAVAAIVEAVVWSAGGVNEVSLLLPPVR